MRAKVGLAIIAALLAVAYLSSPLIAAYKLRQAVKSADTQAIDRMVDWPSVRDSLRSSIARNAKLLPIAHQAGREVRPTMWQRVRAVFGHSMLDRFIERYVTPEGLPKLYKVKTAWNEKVRGREADDALPLAERIAGTWRRVRRAEFMSPFRFVLEMQDRHVPNRIVRSTFRLSNLSLTGFDWTLTKLAIKHVDPARSAHLAKLNGF